MNVMITWWPEVFATKSIEATVIARLIVDEIIPGHGPPEWFLSDLALISCHPLLKRSSG
jgi:hypothetical protein